jgi:hypothetical protein
MAAKLLESVTKDERGILCGLGASVVRMKDE